MTHPIPTRLITRFHRNVLDGVPHPTVTVTCHSADEIMKLAFALIKSGQPGYLDIGTDLVLSQYLHLKPAQFIAALQAAGLSNTAARDLLSELTDDQDNVALLVASVIT